MAELVPALASGSGWVAFSTLAILVIRAILRDQLVPGATHRRALRELVFWRTRALAGTSLAEAATDVVEEHIDVA